MFPLRRDLRRRRSRDARLQHRRGNICDGDFNGDCTTDGIDWAFMRRVFHTQNRRADLNGDGTVDAEDAMLILAMRDQPPGPSGVATCGAL